MRPGMVRTAMLEDGRRARPYVQKMSDDGMDVAAEVVAQLVVLLASGKADALNGRVLSVQEDLEAIVREAQRMRREELYLLRMRSL
jgi:hypothetical protein